MWRLAYYFLLLLIVREATLLLENVWIYILILCCCSHRRFADTHQFLLCTVAVGRSYVQDDAAAARSPPPTGFDSVYLHSEESADAAAGAGETYRHDYVVFDGTQAMPRYVVHFSYPPGERSHRTPISAINLSDIKARVAEALSVLGPAASAATEKMLSDIGDTYERCLNASAEPDPLLEQRRRSIREGLRGLDDKLRAVQANSAAVEESLYQKLQEALLSLQEETSGKVNLLLSEELELRRQQQQIEWTDAFVGEMQESLPPMSFIAAWERHSALRAALYAQLGSLATRGGAAGGGVARILEEVQADLALVGHIEVVSERAAARFKLGGGGGSVLDWEGRAGMTGGSGTGAVSRSGVLGLPPSSAAASGAAAGGTGGTSLGDLWAHTLARQQQQQAGGAAATSVSHLASQHLAATSMAQQQQMSSSVGSQTEPHSSSSSSSGGGGAHAVTLSSASSSSSGSAQTGPPMSLAPEPSLTTLSGSGGSASPRSFVVSSAPAPASSGGSSAAVATAVKPPPSAAPLSTPTTTAAAAALTPTAAPIPTPTAAGASLEDRLAQYSLRREAERRRRQRGLLDSDLGCEPALDPSLTFPGSRILEGAPEDAAALYMMLPVDAVAGGPDGGVDPVSAAANGGGGGLSLPITRLLYATWADEQPPSIAAVVSKYVNEGMREPTLVLVRANGQVFGGFAADPWDFSGLLGGSPRSFLFSLTRDVKVPYTGRVRGPRQPNDDFLRQQHDYAQMQIQAQYMSALQNAKAQNGGVPQFDEAGRLLLTDSDEFGNIIPVAVPVPRPKPFVRHDCLSSDGDTLQFGLRDLVLSGDLSSCTSELEYSYGLGLKQSSPEARCLLADAPIFAVEALEVWAVSSSAGWAANGGGRGDPHVVDTAYSGGGGGWPGDYDERAAAYAGDGGDDEEAYD